MCKVLGELFLEARELFGVHSDIAAAVQNPGCLKKQDDVEDLFREADKEVQEKHREYLRYREEVQAWKEALKEAFIAGKIS